MKNSIVYSPNSTQKLFPTALGVAILPVLKILGTIKDDGKKEDFLAVELNKSKHKWKDLDNLSMMINAGDKPLINVSAYINNDRSLAKTPERIISQLKNVIDLRDTLIRIGYSLDNGAYDEDGYNVDLFKPIDINDVQKVYKEIDTLIRVIQ